MLNLFNVGTKLSNNFLPSSFRLHFFPLFFRLSILLKEAKHVAKGDIMY